MNILIHTTAASSDKARIVDLVSLIDVDLLILLQSMNMLIVGCQARLPSVDSYFIALHVHLTLCLRILERNSLHDAWVIYDICNLYQYEAMPNGLTVSTVHPLHDLGTCHPHGPHKLTLAPFFFSASTIASLALTATSAFKLSI